MKKKLLFWSMLMCIFAFGNAQVDGNGNIIFADPIFECALTQPRVGQLVIHDPNQVYIDVNRDGKISVAEARDVISLYPYTNTEKECGGLITDLTGIGEFTNLTSLVVPGNNITTADLSRNLKLADINFRGTGLESIELGNNLSPIFLKLSDNNLTSIDVSKNINIPYLEISRNQITDIDISNNTLLEHLYIDNNLITSLDAKNCSLARLSLRNNPNLREAFLTGQPFRFIPFEVGPDTITFEAVDLSYCPNLEFICVDQIYVDEALGKKAQPNHSNYTVSTVCSTVLDRNISSVEERALKVIYNTMGGDNWSNSWNMSASPSEWSGVTIENGTVVGLEFPNSNVRGSLPSEFEFLTNLKVLDLSGNSIGGNIPDEMGRLVNLEILNLGNNNFTGNVGDDLPTLNLKELYLNDNAFTGADYIYNLRNLEILNLSNNSLRNGFKSEIGSFRKLRELYLNDNNISGNFEDEIGNLTNLEVLDVSNNNMSGELHNEMDRMISLTTFDISNNNFTCVDIQPAYSFLSTIDNFTYDFASTSTIEKRALEVIYNTMGGYSWTDNNWDLRTDISEWSGVTIENCKVVGLELPNSNVRGNLPSEFEFLTNLKVLDLSGNSISGNIPDEMESLVNLEVLNLGNNNFAGNVGDDLPTLNLKELYLNDNAFTGADYIYDLRNLEILDLSNNSLRNVFQSEIGSFKKLRELYLNDNNISGNFEDEIGNLTNLEVLDASNNNMSGELHNEMSRMVSLKTVDISNNKFTCDDLEPAHSFLKTIDSYTYLQQEKVLDCSIDESNFLDYFTISPNPTTGILILKVLDDSIAINYILLYDMAGNTVGSFPSNTRTMVVSYLTTNNYFIRIVTDKGEFTTQFIKL